MQIDDIRLLAEIMKEQELTSLEWSHEGETLKLTRTQPGCGGTASAPQATVQAVACCCFRFCHPCLLPGRKRAFS